MLIDPHSWWSGPLYIRGWVLFYFLQCTKLDGLVEPEPALQIWSFYFPCLLGFLHVADGHEGPMFLMSKELVAV